MRRALLLSLLLALGACGDSSDSPKGDDTQEDGDDASTDGDGGDADGAPADGEPADGTPADGTPADGSDDMPEREDPFVRRPITFEGPAVSYSPYRDGQSPVRETPDGGGEPTDAQILEDLTILARHWKNFRTYGAGPVTENVVRVLDESGLDMKVMLGAWLEPETDEAAMQRNEEEVARALRIASEHPEQIAAISVGNEVLVDWSTHKVPETRVVYFVRKVRAQTTLPVTVADNYAWWRGLGGELAKDVDFVVIHTYPLWEKYDIDLMDPTDRKAIEYTILNYDGVKTRHPDLPIVIGEAGWASVTNWNAQIVAGAGSEEKQKVYYEQLMEWTEENGITCFTFEAFDENWKGGPSPAETEKHWGLFTSDRMPKLVVKEQFSDLMPSEL